MSSNSSNKLTPKLRFPEFRDDWNGAVLKDVADIVSDRVSPGSVALEDFVSTENILSDFGGLTLASNLPSTGSVTRFRTNDVLVSNIRPYLKKVWAADRDGGASNDVIVIRAKPVIREDYFACVLRSESFIAHVMKGAKGVKMPRGDIGLTMEYPVSYPSPAEQRKIADCLSSLDELIAAEGRKLESLRAYKKGLMQQLFARSGETTPRLRFPEFRKAGEWAIRKLSEFIVERNEVAGADIPLFSLTIEDGVTAKTERYERSFLVNDEESAYKVVKPNDFAFNPMNLRFGAIARHSGENAVALSKYYNIFYCDPSMDPRYCGFYFKTADMVSLYDRIATGSLIEKRRVHFDRFLKLDLPFPALREQRLIADCFFTLDERIGAQSEKRAALRAHKKGLMQQLFPAATEAEA